MQGNELKKDGKVNLYPGADLRVDFIQHRFVKAPTSSFMRAAFCRKLWSFLFFVKPLNVTAGGATISSGNEAQVLYPRIILKLPQ